MNRPTASAAGALSAEQNSVVAYDVRGLHFGYGGRRATTVLVLRDVSLLVEAGRIVGIVGPNGSGKTSLLKLLAKLATPQQGTITLFGRPLQELSQEAVATTVAFVPQDSPQTFPFTVAEMVLMGRFPHRRTSRWEVGFGWEDETDCAVAAQAMAMMDIEHLASRAVTDLSGGERQRVMIARALAQSPRVLLLDEPTAFLDLQHQLDICTIMQRLQAEQGLTIVIVSHDLNLAAQSCDQLVMMKDGAVSAVGRPAEVMTVDRVRVVYGCDVLIDAHPESGLPRMTLPRRALSSRTSV